MLGLNKRNGWTIFSLYLVKFSNIEANEARAIKIFCRYMIANDERSIGIQIYEKRRRGQVCHDLFRELKLKAEHAERSAVQVAFVVVVKS